MSVIEKGNKFFMSDEVYIEHNIRNKESGDYHKHYHDFVEMVYMLKGKCIHTVDGMDYPMSRGDFLIVNYNRLHSISGADGVEYINILMKPEYISRSLVSNENAFALLHLSEFEDFEKILDESKCMVSFSGKERECFEENIFFLENELANKNPGYHLAVFSRFNLLLINLFRKMSFPIIQRFGGMNEEVLLYIRQHCREKITLSEIAKMCSYNTSYFSRLFKEYTGINFMEYVKKSRLEIACSMLSETNLKINDIYSNVGYSDKTKFFAHFKEFMHMTPLEYRKSKK